MDIASRLDTAMKASGIIDQKLLATLSGVPASTINRILSGRNKSVNLKHAQALARVLKVSLHWLACGDEDPNDDESFLIAAITRREKKIIDIYRSCSPEGKDSILIAAESVSKVFPV
ncbi:helix-turn-helix domain-containing protein [Undibacterium sp. CY21W]|uniref:helix-turn-helix domain-containing protein n=1 Tax=Undibacterium sp. CY21W TaxID=2762293 RepID=UPI00164C5BC5|nr:helix-turn-helix domain-containing protein [Undibacterium sp. CY21W]MBC3927795.1 helix-turn-helix transcriptional regulator [Undibacterium sp. CY21W]